MKIQKLVLFAFFVSAFSSACCQLQWKVVAPGVWKAIIGKPESYNLISASGAKPSIAALSKLGQAGFPLTQSKISASIEDGKTQLRFPLDTEEEIYGLGLNFQTVHQRGRILQLHVDHYGHEDNGRTHAPT